MPNMDLGEAQASGVLSIRAVEQGSAATLRPVDGGPTIADVLSVILAVEPSGPGGPVVALDVTTGSTADEAPAVLAALISSSPAWLCGGWPCVRRASTQRTAS